MNPPREAVQGIYPHEILKRHTFLGINLYTRFFELFWDNLHKTVFFGLQALSFWYIGSNAESIWNLGKGDEARTPINER